MRRALLVLAAFTFLATACGGEEEPPEPPAAAPETAPTTTAEAPEPVETEAPVETETETEPMLAPPPPGAPEFVAGYRGWPRLNDAPIGPRDSDPHLGTKEVYASKTQNANGRFPNGTVVVKEASRPGKDFIGLLAIMRKQRGADPEHNDWVFVEYTRDGPDERFTELARGAVCWGCHIGAAETDYVFTAG